MFFGHSDDDGKRYNDRDREMLKALHLFRHGQCPGCGFPKSEVWVEPEDKQHEYIAEEVQCQTCAALESERSGKKTEKGLHYFIVRHPKGTPNPERPERDVDEG